jgi:hypothetical protein
VRRAQVEYEEMTIVVPVAGLVGSSVASISCRSWSRLTVWVLRRRSPVRVLDPKKIISERASPKWLSISVIQVSTRALGTRTRLGAN